MVAVFVSHSKHDAPLRKYFSEIFASIGLKAYFMEWHDLHGQYSGDKISRMIEVALLVIYVDMKQVLFLFYLVKT